MKITIVQGAFLPVPAILGGAVEKVWSALGGEFAARGHAVTHLSRCYRDLPADEMIDGVRHLRFPGFDAPRSLFHLKFLDFLYSARVRRHIPTADVLVTNTFWLPLLVRDASRGRIYIHVARYPKGQMRFYSRAARLQTVSQPVAEAIAREAPKMAARVRVIPYPLIEARPATTSADANASRKKHLLYVGRVHPEKGVHLLIQAVAAIPRDRLGAWRLIIVGPSEVRLGGGGEGYFQRLRALAAPIADRVEFAGGVFDPARLAAIYRAAPIFVYPSLADHGETFGLAPLEAMSHGCAPVISDLPCFHDFIEQGVDGLAFDHRSPQAIALLAARLLELMEDSTLRARLSAAALRKTQQYAFARVTTAFLEDFQSLLDPTHAKLLAVAAH